MAPKRRQSPTTVRDAVGMTIPEARLRRDRISYERFDEEVGQASRDLLGVEELAVDVEEPSLRARASSIPHDGGVFGAHYDRRFIRYQGTAEDAERVCAHSPNPTEVATNKLMDGESSGSSYSVMKSAVHADTAQGGSRDARAYVRDAASTNTTQTEGAMTMARHFARAERGEAYASIARAGQRMTLPEMVEPASARPTGRKESQRTAAMDAPEQHPCRLQCTVCASAAGRRTFATVCPHLRDSEVCCLEQLKRGVCRRHLQGCCPWHHGSGRSHALMQEEALIPDRDWNETASSMNDDDEGRTSQNYIRRTVPERLQAGAPWVRTLLQLFVDAFLTVLQRGEGEAYEAFMAASTPADRVRILMESINPLDSVSLGEEEVLYQVTMDTGLNVCVVPWAVARHAVLNEDSTETESEMLQHFANDDVPHLWSSYLISVNGADNKGGSPCVGLSPLLYDWAVEAVRITAITSTLSSSPLMSASSFLMRRRWEHVNARRREENSMHGGRHGARVKSGDHIHEWAPLLLLQDCLRWRHLPADESTAGEASMLSALVLQHEEATETLPCRHATERWDRSWSTCHRFMLTLADALHQYPSAQYGSITAFVQPALVHLATHLASTQVAPHEEALRQAAGWQAWTTEQMCSPAHQAYFTPARYARHHLPFVYSALLNSLLNGLLLLSLRRTSVRCSMDECSPVVDALMSRSLPYTATLARDVAAGAPTVRRYAAQQVLSRCTPVSLRYLAALQELSVHVEQQRVELSEEFKSRHRTYHQERESSARHTHMKRRTYHDLQDRLSELLENSYASVPMIDRLLPHGTVAVCPEATAMLLRQLVDYAGYRALKLASSIIHASRMLRHAAKRPLPQLVEGEKTVHRSMRNKKTMRTHAVPVRVRTWYIQHGMDEEKKGSESAVRPLGLAYPITETVMEALVRVGLCMGDAGAKLADGVREDCVAGSLVDHAEGRVLPMLTSEAVEGYCNTHPAIAPGAGIASTICHLLLDPPVDDDGALPAGRRIPPTSGLVELCVLYTSPTDSTRQTRYRGLLRQDLTRFGTPPVLVAQQYAVMRSGRMGLVRQAILAAHTAWVQCLASMPALTQAEVQWCASLQSEVRQTRGEVEELLSQQDRVQPTSSVAAVSSTEDLKKFLRGEGEGAATTEGPSGPSRSFPYAGLMVSTAAQHRHGRSRLMAILALSTGGLLGLGEEALSTREGDVTSYARLLLRNAFVTAELLLPTSERGQRVQDPRLMVVRSLLHAGVWAGEVVDDGVRGTERTAATAVARPFHAALSGVVLSAFLRRQLSLRLTLCGRDAACGNDALLEQLSRSLSPQPTADGNEDGTMAGQLFSSLCAHPAVASRWLSHTLLYPSAELLLWIATRLPDRDASAAQTMSLWVDAVRQRRQLSQDEGEEDSQMMELVVRRLEDIQKRRPRGLPS